MDNITNLQPGTSVLKELYGLHADTNEPAQFSKWFGVSPLTSDTFSWYQGYLGELVTAEALGSLIKDGWTVYHSVPVGSNGSDVDHVVVSPEGVIFTLNTKHHRGKSVWVSEKQVRVGGQPQPYVRNSRFEAERVHKKTGTPVVPVLVFVNVSKLDIKPGADKNGILIATPNSLVKQLRKANKVFTETFVSPYDISSPNFWAERFEDHTVDHEERVGWFKTVHSHHITAMVMRPVWGLIAVGLGIVLLNLLV